MIFNIPATTPIRPYTTHKNAWSQEDEGIIYTWERGRELALIKTELAEKAKSGELPILPWAGGVDKNLISGKKTGSLYYLAMWSGLRGDDLIMDTDQETLLTCPIFGVEVTYTKHYKHTNHD